MVAPLLQNGDYVIVEDTNLDGHAAAVSPGWGPSPYDAVVNFMAMNRHFFRRDLAREKKWGFTQSINGFLIGNCPALASMLRQQRACRALAMRLHARRCMRDSGS
jgi:hypothetical protein